MQLLYDKGQNRKKKKVETVYDLEHVVATPLGFEVTWPQELHDCQGWVRCSTFVESKDCVVENNRFFWSRDASASSATDGGQDEGHGKGNRQGYVEDLGQGRVQEKGEEEGQCHEQGQRPWKVQRQHEQEPVLEQHGSAHQKPASATSVQGVPHRVEPKEAGMQLSPNEEVCSKCRTPKARAGSRFCDICGERFPEDAMFSGLYFGGETFNPEDRKEDVLDKLCKALGNLVRATLVKEELEDEPEEASAGGGAKEESENWRFIDCGMVDVTVLDVHFMQHGIKKKFRDGRPLDEYVADLKSGRLDPLNLKDPLNIIEWPRQGFVTLDHRRLWCLQKYATSVKECVKTRAHVCRLPVHFEDMLRRHPLLLEVLKKFHKISPTIHLRGHH